MSYFTRYFNFFLLYRNYVCPVSLVISIISLFSCPVSLVISIITLDFKLTSPSIGYYYSEIPQNSILICRVQIHGPGWTRADLNGPGRTWADPGGPGRTRMDLDGLGQTWTDPDRTRRTQALWQLL